MGKLQAIRPINDNYASEMQLVTMNNNYHRHIAQLTSREVEEVDDQTIDIGVVAKKEEKLNAEQMKDLFGTGHYDYAKQEAPSTNSALGINDAFGIVQVVDFDDQRLEISFDSQP